MEMFSSSAGVGGPSLLDGDRGLRFPRPRKANALSFPRDVGLRSRGGDEMADAAEEARDMVDWLASGDGCLGYGKGWWGDRGELGARDWESGRRECMDRFRR